MDFKLEVAVIPVADVERAKDFYTSLGWRLDADFTTPPDFRVVQFTPPGSPASIHFGSGVTEAEPGSANHYLVVDDIVAAQKELAELGAPVSDVFHFAAGTRDQVAGPDEQHTTYSSFAVLNDPDGNRYTLQEITTRLPGRE